MAKQWVFIHNAEKCVGCKACEMACKNENQVSDSPRWRRVYTLKEDAFGSIQRSYMSLGCNHCDAPECKRVCPTGAYTKRDDGIVIHNPQRCIGCRLCTMACPYNAPQFNKQRGKVEKCHLCFHRIDAGLKPACVAACIPRALEVVDISQLDEKTLVRAQPGFPDPSITHPNIRFVTAKSRTTVLRQV